MSPREQAMAVALLKRWRELAALMERTAPETLDIKLPEVLAEFVQLADETDEFLSPTGGSAAT